MKTITIEIDDKGNIQKIKTLSYWFDIEKYLLSEIHKEFLYNLSILADLYKETFCELTHIDTKSISKETLTSIFYLLSNPKEQTKSLMYNFLFTYPDISQTDESKMCLTKTPSYITSRDFINNVYAVKPHCSAKEFDQLCEQYKNSIIFCDGILKKGDSFITIFHTVRSKNLLQFQQEQTSEKYTESNIEHLEALLENRNNKLNIYKIENYTTEDLLLYGYLQCLKEIDVYTSLCEDGITVTYIIPEDMKQLIKEYSLQENYVLKMPSGTYYLCAD